MIKFNELKQGDIVMGEYEGKMWHGEVTRLNGDEKQVCLKTEVQEFWFEVDKLHAIPLDEAQMFKLGFQKDEPENGSVKYKKGAFRFVTPTANSFNEMEMWYREDRRFIDRPIAVHELQNYHLDMTKVHLNEN